MTRRWALEGVENFRDFGDYEAVDGRRLKKGRFYRSASHGRATDADLETIAKLDIALVVDLRRKGERTRDPSRRPLGFRGEVIDNDLGDEGEDSWMVHVRDSDLTEASFRNYLLDYYRAAPFEERHLDLFSRYFKVLAQVDGAVLVHCAAGKDRTGILVALTHHLAGVHRETIVEDYLLTNHPERLAARMPMIAKAMEEIAGRAPSEAVMQVALGVDVDYLNTAMAAIEERYGNLDGYLERALGVDAGLRSSLRDRLLA
jgi:protein tyrosine/serine phosphatase